MDNNYEKEMKETIESGLIDETELIPTGGVSKYEPEVETFDYIHSKDGQDLMTRMRALLQDDDDGEEEVDVYVQMQNKIKNANDRGDLIKIRQEIQNLPDSKERHFVIKKYNEKVQQITLEK